MSHTLPEVNWFALAVKSRHEKAVGEHMRAQGVQEYVPLVPTQRKWSDRTKTLDLPLFPNYVFCRFTFEDRFKALNAPGVYSLVGFGGVPACIPNREIEAVQRIVQSARPVAPWPFVRVGEHVRIEHGSMTGLEGVLIRDRDLFRVVVSIEMLQRSVAVEIDREMLSLIGPSTTPPTGTSLPA